MPIPSDCFIDAETNYLLKEERSYDRDELRKKHQEWLGTITTEQKSVYDQILGAVRHGSGGMFYVYGFGGSGKTFLWSILGAALRSEGHIVLNVASSGIAALLLPGGRTAHSRFGIPLVVNQYTMCTMKAGSHIAELIKEAKLIIWDEAPMMSKYCFETLDRSLKDILKCNKPFGGKVVVFGVDFRQILPVIQKGGRVETVMATLNSSYLWRNCKVLQLTKNMRLNFQLCDQDKLELSAFSKWILDIGDGKINAPNDGETEIDIPEDLLITDCENPIEAIVNEVYGETYASETNPKFFQGRAILSPRNKDVEKINDYMLNRIAGEEKTYFSADSIEPSDRSKLDSMLYSKEYLNSVKVSGLPAHELKLKIGVPVMLLRNIDSHGGLCNGTRLLITAMADHVIEGCIITGPSVGQTVLIPRMFLTPPDGRFPYRMRRKQFPFTIAFAMTINKSQGQTLEKVGLYLLRPVFTHGQLYVAVYRVTSRTGLRILITDTDGKPQKRTMNVVYNDVFKLYRLIKFQQIYLRKFQKQICCLKLAYIIK